MIPDPITTGTGAARRRLSLEEAARGGKPEPFTDAEWAALHKASREEAEIGACRHIPPPPSLTEARRRLAQVRGLMTPVTPEP